MTKTQSCVKYEIFFIGERLLMAKDDSKLKIIETFDDYPLDEKSSFRVYLGRDIPKQNPEDAQLIVTDEELTEFFDTQEALDGLTRVYCDGIWKGESEQSVMVIALNVTLREVMTFGYDYMDAFEQLAVYIEITNTKSFEYLKEYGNVASN
ncbi:MAG: hypothetical protein HC932_01205 [Thermales bacterium]|nr:hypothetical protein [Thermales bacterium]